MSSNMYQDEAYRNWSLKTCPHSNSDCSCQLSFGGVQGGLKSLIIPRNYLYPENKKQKKVSQAPRKKKSTLQPPNDPKYFCYCTIASDCKCELIQQTCCINTHQYQSIIIIPLRFRKGLKQIKTFMKANQEDLQTTQQEKEKEDIITTIPSEFSCSYLETNQWTIQLKAHHVPKNQSNIATLYVLIEGDVSGKFKVPLKVVAKQQKKHPVCNRLKKCQKTKKKQSNEQESVKRSSPKRKYDQMVQSIDSCSEKNQKVEQKPVENSSSSSSSSSTLDSSSSGSQNKLCDDQTIQESNNVVSETSSSSSSSSSSVSDLCSE